MRISFGIFPIHTSVRQSSQSKPQDALNAKVHPMLETGRPQATEIEGVFMTPTRGVFLNSPIEK
jgi:hypothetical protein